MRPSTSLLPLLAPRSTLTPLSLATSSLIFRPSFRTLTTSTLSLNANAKSTTPLGTKKISDRPFKIEHKPVYPPPNNPFAPAPKPKHYSDLTLRILRRVNKVLGYNRRRRTSARETQRMVGGILEAVEADKAFWYTECDLPKTFHTFYSTHIVYVLITLVRLRALPDAIANPLSPLPQSRLPGLPGTTTPARPPSIIDTLDNAVSPPHYFRYQEQLLTHFFNVLENEVRLMLGPKAQDREIKRIMVQYNARWNAAKIGLDYALGLGKSEIAEERERSDSELASWAWRLVFARRGQGENGQGELVWPEGEEMKAGKDVEMASQLETIVRFVRRELGRLEGISNRDVLAGNVAYWGRVKG